MTHSRRYTASPFGRRGAPVRLNCVMVLILVNVLGFLLIPRMLLGELALTSFGVRQLKLWQLVSYMFLHGSVSHLLINMWGLYLFGNHVLSRLGQRRFLTLYGLSGISGALLWLAFNWNARTPVIGASGAVFGVMMAAALFFPSMRIMLLFPPVTMTLRTLVLIYAGIEVLSELGNMQGGVAHLAHLGGFLGAYFYVRYLSGETCRDLLRHPVRWTVPSGTVGSARPPQSQVNRKTFEQIMAEIEELERQQREHKEPE